MRFLGVALPDIENNTVIVDICPDLPKLSSNQRKRRIVPVRETMFYKLPQKVQHRETWAIFQRVLRVTGIDQRLWPQECTNALDRLDESDFSTQRNLLHYGVNQWLLDDLHDCTPIDGFGRHGLDLYDGSAFDVTATDFSFIVVLGLVRLATQLFSDIATVNPLLHEEWRVLEGWMNRPWCSLYRTAYSFG
jgi:hypothetical protein